MLNEKTERTFLDLDRREAETKRLYYSLINSQEETLRELLNEENWCTVATKEAVSKSLIRRMINHFAIENEQKSKVGRLKLGVGIAGTYFEDILAMYLRSYLSSRTSGVKVHLGKTLAKAAVPDITTTKNERNVAFIELKSNFNWHRQDHWRDINRKYEVYRKYVGQDAIFVVVLSKALLKDEPLDDFKKGCKVEKRNICVLMEEHPGGVFHGTPVATEPKVCEPIEPLFERIGSLPGHSNT